MSSVKPKPVEVIDLTEDTTTNEPPPPQINKGKFVNYKSPHHTDNGPTNGGFGNRVNAVENSNINTMFRPLPTLKQAGQVVRHFKRVNKPVQTLGEGPIAPGCKQNTEAQSMRERSLTENPQLKRSRTEQSFEPGSCFGKREWELTPFGKEYQEKSQEGLPFSLMSYNVLAQDLLYDNQYLYRNHPEQVLDWEFRKQKLLQEFNDHRPDVLCLQEVQKSHLEEFYRPQLKALGYECEFLQRTSGKVDGCATFYKRGKFRMEEVRHVHYFQVGSPLTNRDNVGLILKLAPLNGQEGVCVANTHLLYNPKRGDIKLLQLVKLLAELDHMVPDFQTVPIILCGDFNARPHSFMYKFISQGYLRYHGLPLEDISAQRFGGGRKLLNTGLIPSNLTISDQCHYLEDHHVEKLRKSPVLQGQFYSYQSSPYHHFHFPSVSQNSGFLWHRFHLVSTYSHFIERTGEPEVTTQSSASDSSVVDYVFYSVLGRECKSRRGNFNNRNIIEGRIKLLGRLGLLSKKEISAAGNLPNYQNPSDHMPLMVKFLLT
ncbi:protein angel homolog 2-like isoform X2 [Saccostrea echinata]|nr:protein angel homolog 2-like isoform X2 [Saccostrea echinata]